MTHSEIIERLLGALKEQRLTTASRASYKQTMIAWLAGIAQYGATAYGAGRDDLRSRALWFDMGRREFADLINAYVAASIYADRRTRDHAAEAVICERCNHLTWALDLVSVRDNRDSDPAHLVCGGCVQTYYRSCGRCGVYRLYRDGDNRLFKTIQGFSDICLGCFERGRDSGLYAQCESCSRWYQGNSGGRHLGFLYTYNDQGENDSQGTHLFCTTCRIPEKSYCKPKNLNFEFPALNLEAKKVAQDEIFEVATGGGDVSATGMAEIHRLIQRRTKGNGVQGLDVPELVLDAFNFDDRWMTREGNMPKRIAKLLLQNYNLKLVESLMSEIGNIAQRYTSKPGTYRLSITRNVNRPRSEFVNGDSCWWTNFWYSRCTLKSLGGFGLRTWEGEPGRDLRPVGRAWMIPMRAGTANEQRTLGKKLLPAPEMLPADAYIVFNGYGPQNTRLDSMEFGRLVASMTGKSYRKIDLYVDHIYMYVNGSDLHHDSVGKGVLVAPQEICNGISDYYLDSLSMSHIANCDCRGARR